MKLDLQSQRLHDELVEWAKCYDPSASGTIEGDRLYRAIRAAEIKPRWRAYNGIAWCDERHAAQFFGPDSESECAAYVARKNAEEP